MTKIMSLFDIGQGQIVIPAWKPSPVFWLEQYAMSSALVGDASKASRPKTQAILKLDKHCFVLKPMV